MTLLKITKWARREHDNFDAVARYEENGDSVVYNFNPVSSADNQRASEHYFCPNGRCYSEKRVSFAKSPIVNLIFRNEPNCDARYHIEIIDCRTPSLMSCDASKLSCYTRELSQLAPLYESTTKSS